jgi:cyclic-di-AMP phosphodiesterase PgpH
LQLRTQVVHPRPGQAVDHDIVARVGFKFRDSDKLARAQEQAMLLAPHVYRETRPALNEIESMLLSLPERLKGKSESEIRKEVDPQGILDGASIAKLLEYAERNPRPEWDDAVRAFVDRLRSGKLVLLSDEDRKREYNRQIRILPSDQLITGDQTLSDTMGDALRVRVEQAARETIPLLLTDRVSRLALLNLQFAPTYTMDEPLTKLAQEEAERRVEGSDADIVEVMPNQRIIQAGNVVREIDYMRLRAENEAYRAQRVGLARENLGLAGCVVLITVCLCAYVARYQKKIIRNHGRGACLALTLLSMLLLPMLAGLGSGQLFFLGVAPSILVAMILSIAYDQRFAVGVSTLHAALVTLALGLPLTFFLILFTGVAAACYATNDLRSRSKLIEIGSLTGVALAAATLFAGLMQGDPLRFVMVDMAWACVAGLAVGFFMLGILPFVEKVFRITTSMSLLELADSSHPLLRKLATEAPGTYQHSMQVSSLCEEAAAVIGADALLARVGAYYHDVGKINKAEYFVENQAGGANRHHALNPNVSMLIIIGHVKDGLALAKEYNLPTKLFPFIQSHHGTTLVEFFFRRAQQREDARPEDDAQEVDEQQYRYPGPKPKSREVAILMLADAAESACRTIDEPTAARIETLVHELFLKRLLDGQFDECDITMRDLELVERSMIRTLIGIYHPRIAYPSNPATVVVERSVSDEPTKVSSAG